MTEALKTDKDNQISLLDVAGLTSWECNGTTPTGQIHDNQSPQGPHESQINFGNSCAYCGLTKEQVVSKQGGANRTPTKAIVMLGVAGVVFTSYNFLHSIFAKREVVPQVPPNTKNLIKTPPPSQSISWFTMAGSNTIGKSLAPRLVETFMEAEGCSNIRETRSKAIDDGKEHEIITIDCRINSNSYSVTIKPWGSNYALKFLLGDESADIAMMSRRIDNKDIATFPTASGLRTRDSEHVIGLDAIAIIANQQSTMQSVSIPHLRKIFSTGLDDEGKQYKLFSRDSKSGTYDTFVSLVMNKQPIFREATLLEDSDELVKDVASRPGALGYVSLAAAERGGVSILPIRSTVASAIFRPNRFTIKSEDYPLTRRLYFYINKFTSNQKVTKFVDFVSGTEGQRVVDANDFVSQSLLADSSEEHATKCTSLFAGSKALSTKFRFETGSNLLDSKAAADLSRLKDYLNSQSISPSRVLLLGFADNDGSKSTNEILSENRASEVALQLRQVGIIIDNNNIKGYGSSYPVASNENEEGKAKNRRVEVCVKP